MLGQEPVTGLYAGPDHIDNATERALTEWLRQHAGYFDAHAPLKTVARAIARGSEFEEAKTELGSGSPE